jgi:tRNA 2-thiouridine synthesizing protein A
LSFAEVRIVARCPPGEPGLERKFSNSRAVLAQNFAEEAKKRTFELLHAVDGVARVGHVRAMTTTRLDLTGLKCPLPALKTRKSLKALQPGDFLEVHCTDPLSVIDIPTLIGETGDRLEIVERTEQRIVFLIEKRTNHLSAAVGGA